MQNDTCPITLESLSGMSGDEIFVHADVGFEMVALYEYLVTAPKFINPLNRVVLTLADLERLEAQMETLFGMDCILRTEQGLTESCQGDTEVEDDDDDDEEGGEESDDDQYSVTGEINWLDDTELISRLNTSIMDVTTESNARVIRLRVDIDMNDVELASSLRTEPAAPPPSPSSVVEEEEEEDEFLHITPDALPPRRTFPSLTDMHRDTGRERRIGERLSLLQYLEYDAMGILVQILDMAYDNHFHRFVWQHTSLDVMDTVTTYLTQGTDSDSDDIRSGQIYTRITEPSPSPPSTADYDLEVVYTECWEVYRHVIIENLERRYSETARDILRISLNDFRALFASHRAHVRQRATEHAVDYSSVQEMLSRLEHDIVPRNDA
jgi:hypothetical protein